MLISSSIFVFSTTVALLDSQFTVILLYLILASFESMASKEMVPVTAAMVTGSACIFTCVEQISFLLQVRETCSYFCCLTILGISKHVKDHIRECAHCQSRRSADDSSGPRAYARPGRRRTTANLNEEEDEEEEEEGVENLFFTGSSTQQQRSKLANGTPKHELVFVSTRRVFSVCHVYGQFVLRD